MHIAPRSRIRAAARLAEKGGFTEHEPRRQHSEPRSGPRGTGRQADQHLTREQHIGRIGGIALAQDHRTGGKALLGA